MAIEGLLAIGLVRTGLPRCYGPANYGGSLALAVIATAVYFRFHHTLVYVFLVVILRMVTKVTPDLITLPIIPNSSRRSLVMVRRSPLACGFVSAVSSSVAASAAATTAVCRS